METRPSVLHHRISCIFSENSLWLLRITNKLINFIISKIISFHFFIITTGTGAGAGYWFDLASLFLGTAVIWIPLSSSLSSCWLSISSKDPFRSPFFWFFYFLHNISKKFEDSKQKIPFYLSKYARITSLMRLNFTTPFVDWF